MNGMNWTVHPGEILGEVMEERGWTFDDLVARSAVSPQILQKLLYCDPAQTISLTTAQGLRRATGVSVKFWVRLEADYRNGIVRDQVAARAGLKSK